MDIRDVVPLFGSPPGSSWLFSFVIWILTLMVWCTLHMSGCHSGKLICSDSYWRYCFDRTFTRELIAAWPYLDPDFNGLVRVAHVRKAVAVGSFVSIVKLCLGL